MVEFALVLVDKQQQEWKSIEMQKNKKENKVGIVRFQDIENMQQSTGTIESIEKLDRGSKLFQSPDLRWGWWLIGEEARNMLLFP